MSPRQVRILRYPQRPHDLAQRRTENVDPPRRRSRMCRPEVTDIRIPAQHFSAGRVTTFGRTGIWLFMIWAPQT